MKNDMLAIISAMDELENVKIKRILVIILKFFKSIIDIWYLKFLYFQYLSIPN